MNFLSITVFFEHSYRKESRFALFSVLIYYARIILLYIINLSTGSFFAVFPLYSYFLRSNSRSAFLQLSLQCSKGKLYIFYMLYAVIKILPVKLISGLLRFCVLRATNNTGKDLSYSYIPSVAASPAQKVHRECAGA